MHASDQELENLKRLQHIDAEVIRNKKKLDELPQRQTILETRQKLSAIIKKKTQVQDMIDAFEDELHALLSEDERLEKKQQETQEALDRVKGDYRSVESYTKDLHGVVKRREKLTQDMERVDGELARSWIRSWRGAPSWMHEKRALSHRSRKKAARSRARSHRQKPSISSWQKP